MDSAFGFCWVFDLFAVCFGVGLLRVLCCFGVLDSYCDFWGFCGLVFGFVFGWLVWFCCFGLVLGLGRKRFGWMHLLCFVGLMCLLFYIAVVGFWGLLFWMFSDLVVCGFIGLIVLIVAGELVDVVKFWVILVVYVNFFWLDFALWFVAVLDLFILLLLGCGVGGLNCGFLFYDFVCLFLLVCGWFGLQRWFGCID